MVRQEPVKIGIVPVKRKFLSLENAVTQKERILAKLRAITPAEVELVGIDDIVESGVLWDDYGNLEKVMNKMRGARLDGLFMPHCDFGTEEVVGKLGREIGAPFLLWGERDAAPLQDQPRSTDTQCGIFASSRALQRYGVPFSYIVNSMLDSDRFVNGYLKFTAVASVVKSFRRLRIAQVGQRPRQFMSVICNEDELMNRHGIEIVPVSAAEIMSKVQKYLAEKASLVDELVADFNRRMDCASTKEETQRKLAALTLALADNVRENGCDAIALECWSLFAFHMGFMPCLAAAELNGMGIPVSCETDVPGAISSVLLDAAAFGRKETFFADLTMRHPDNDNAELLWHCGPFPYSLKAEDSPAKLVGGKGDWRLKDGDITIARLDAMNGQYFLFSGEGKTTSGPPTTGTYVWYEVDNWEKWEEKLINGPYIHHVSGIYGKYASVLAEACKYMPGVQADIMGNA